MQTEIVWKEGVHFEATSGTGHTINLDGPADYGGQNLGARPMELMLIGAGSCSAFDVMMILKKGRQQVTGCKVELDAERAPEPPRVFTKITMRFIVTGRNLSPQRVKRAIELSAEQFCSASIMLKRAGVEIESMHEIIEEDGEE